MATGVTNMARLAVAFNKINFYSHTFKICLMASGFTFDPASHDKWSDVSGSELSGGYGYTQNDKTLSTPPSISIDISLDRAKIVWANVVWTATGGSIGPTPGAIIHCPSVVSGDGVDADPILCYIDFGTDITQASGGLLTVSNIRIDI